MRRLGPKGQQDRRNHSCDVPRGWHEVSGLCRRFVRGDVAGHVHEVTGSGACWCYRQDTERAGPFRTRDSALEHAALVEAGTVQQKWRRPPRFGRAAAASLFAEVLAGRPEVALCTLHVLRGLRPLDWYSHAKVHPRAHFATTLAPRGWAAAGPRLATLVESLCADPPASWVESPQHPAWPAFVQWTRLEVMRRLARYGGGRPPRLGAHFDWLVRIQHYSDAPNRDMVALDQPLAELAAQVPVMWTWVEDRPSFDRQSWPAVWRQREDHMRVMRDLAW